MTKNPTENVGQAGLVFPQFCNYMLTCVCVSVNLFCSSVIVPSITSSWICRSLRNTFFRYFTKRRDKISYRIRRFFEVFWYQLTSVQSIK